jgi:hypothetical protein
MTAMIPPETRYRRIVSLYCGVAYGVLNNHSNAARNATIPMIAKIAAIYNAL